MQYVTVSDSDVGKGKIQQKSVRKKKKESEYGQGKESSIKNARNREKTEQNGQDCVRN